MATLDAKSDVEIWKQQHVDKFDPATYLRDRFVEIDVKEDARHFKRIWEEFQSGTYGGKLLEIGCGPSIMVALAASGKHSEMVLSDYCRQNLDAIDAWVKGSKGAHQWDEYIDAVAKLENIGSAEVRSRTIMKIKSLIELDCVKNTDELLNEVTTRFDTVVSVYCYETACAEVEQLRLAARNIFGLLKSGGRTIVVVSAGVSEYHVGKTAFPTLRMSPEELYQSFLDAGFVDCSLKQIPGSTALRAITNTPGVVSCFITAKRP